MLWYLVSNVGHKIENSKKHTNYFYICVKKHIFGQIIVFYTKCPKSAPLRFLAIMKHVPTKADTGLTFINPHFITYTDDTLTVDVLGGVDLQQIERMICTLRITYKNYPPYRSTLDLYNDHQTDKLIRSLCDKWQLSLSEVSKSVHTMINRLENYKLERLTYPKKKAAEFEMTPEEAKVAQKYLAHPKLIENLKNDFHTIGILGEEDNALTLLFAMASHSFNNPFSVLCFAKNSGGRSNLLHLLANCMPQGSYSYHTQITENALYYFDSYQLDGKVLFIEDVEWTQQMLMPLSTLQTQRRLVKTRTTKNKDGMLHSTTFEVTGKLCLIACAYAEKNHDAGNLPFLHLPLHHSHAHEVALMEYQKKCKAGLIDHNEIAKVQRRIQCIIASLKNTSIINPYTNYLNLPDEVPHHRRTLSLLLNFIEVITFFFQYQREKNVDENTGEMYIETHPDDIELAFVLLKDNLLKRPDELSAASRHFYTWLTTFCAEIKTTEFTALDIRKGKRIHPRTLNRYLQELCEYQYLQVAGGNKYREGYRYKITNLDEPNPSHTGMEAKLTSILEQIREHHSRTVGHQTVSNRPSRTTKRNTGGTTPNQKIQGQ